VADDDPFIVFHAGMGQSEILRRMGKPRAAAKRLEKLTPPDAEERLAWLQAMATALSEAEDPEAESVWEQLAIAAEASDETRFSALRGRADALMARELPADALPLYREAEALAPEPWAQGWAALGVAEAQLILGQIDDATQAFDVLREHRDPEVRMQAVIRRADVAADAQDWTTAIELVKPEAAAALGPAWDASATSTRARSLLGAGDSNGAEATWRALANRWPEEEEGFLPAWLGLASLAQHAGDDVEAHRWARKAYRSAVDPGYRAQAEAMVEALASY
jgi:tetratricopeptide (TPR) repeat protein